MAWRKLPAAKMALAVALLVLCACATAGDSVEREQKFIDQTREKFVRSLPNMPTATPAEAADYLIRTLRLSKGDPTNDTYAVLTITRHGKTVTIDLEKPLFGPRDPDPNGFDVLYLDPSVLIDRAARKAQVTQIVGPPLFDMGDTTHWKIANGVLSLRGQFASLVFTPFTHRALLDQVRVPDMPALLDPAAAAGRGAEAVAISGRDNATPDAARIIALVDYVGTPARACIRRLDTDHLAVCGSVVNSDDPRHVFLDYIGPGDDTALTAGIPLLAAFGRQLGVTSSGNVLRETLVSAFTTQQTDQQRLDGNFVLKARAYPASQLLIIRLDVCDRMSHIERQLESGDPCLRR